MNMILSTIYTPPPFWRSRCTCVLQSIGANVFRQIELTEGENGDMLSLENNAADLQVLSDNKIIKRWTLCKNACIQEGKPVENYIIKLIKSEASYHWATQHTLGNRSKDRVVVIISLIFRQETR